MNTSTSHSNDVTPSTMISSQNVTFYDENPAWDHKIISNLDQTYEYGRTTDVDLHDFLSRPIRISNGSWVIGTDTFSANTINPWSLFFSNKRVINRINNYNLLRCNLKVKIVINATPFHYGLLLMSYKPLSYFDSVSKNTRTPSIAYIDLVERSQRPMVYINAADNQGATMSLPFFWYKNWLSVPLSEWDKMGVLQIDIMSQLKHANAGTENVNFSIYAWAEDVVLSAPTVNNSLSLVTQSGDEYGTGVISKPASTVANVMNILSDVPVIGPYAKATSMIASTTAMIAKQFGYSRPNVLDSIKPMRITTHGNLSNVDADDFSQKLSVESKQELTIDPSTVGLHCCDQMTIQSIVSRYSYYTRFQLPAAGLQEGILFQTYVSPTMFNLNGTEIHSTAVCFASLPFTYWTGSITYRFQIVSSKFHKGRIKVVYDPYGLPLTNAEYNIAYTKIVDISNERDFEMTVNWGQTSAFKRVSPVTSTSSLPFSTSDSVNLPYNTIYHNGVLAVYLVNEVTGPGPSTPNLDVIVSVKGGDDLSFAQPTDQQLDALSYFPTPPLTVQSGEIDIDACPMDASSKDDLNQKERIPNKVFLVHFGETISSFRTLLRRYALLYSSRTYRAPGTEIYLSTTIVPNYPFYYGPAPNGLDIVGTTRWNFSHNTLLTYLAPAYLAARGSMRFKVTMDETGIDGRRALTVLNHPDLDLPFSNTVTTIAEATYSRSCRSQKRSGLDGAFINTFESNVATEYEIPFYSPFRFLGTRNITGVSSYPSIPPTTPATTERNDLNFNSYSHVLQHKLSGSDFYYPTFYHATGEDFSLFFYIGPPVLYTQISP